MSLFWVRAFMVMCNLCLSLVIVNIKILSSFTTFEISQNLACGKVKNVMSASEHPIVYDFFFYGKGDHFKDNIFSHRNFNINWFLLLLIWNLYYIVQWL